MSVRLLFFYHSIIYTKNLEKDRLLNKYKSRCQSLSSRTKPGSKSNTIEMYEYYKKEGAIIKDKYKKVKISGKEFEDWIDSTMLRKK